MPTHGQHPRSAERHSVELPLRYRLPQDDAWCAGIVENLSASGVLFRVSREIAVGTPIVVDLRFRSRGHFRVMTRGCVVRVLHSPQATYNWSVAAQLEIHELRRG